MKLSCAVSTVAILLLLSPLSAAQTVEEIVARNLQAKGGEQLLRATTTVRTTARGTMQGQEYQIVTATKRPFLMRNEITLANPPAGPGGQRMPTRSVQAFDGEQLWVAVGEMPPQALPAGPQTEMLKRTSQIDSPLLDYQAKGTTITLGEPAREQGRTLHHLIVTPKGAPQMHYYIDAKTNLESRMTIEVEEGGRTNRMEMHFDDFRTVDGRTVPFTVTQYMNGTQVGRVQFDRIEFNVPLEDAIFRMPR